MLWSSIWFGYNTVLRWILSWKHKIPVLFRFWGQSSRESSARIRQIKSHVSLQCPNKQTEHQGAPLWTWCQIVFHKWEDIFPSPQGNCYGRSPGHHGGCLGVWYSHSQSGDNRRQDKSTSCCHMAIKMQPTPSWKTWRGRHGKRHHVRDKRGKMAVGAYMGSTHESRPSGL